MQHGIARPCAVKYIRVQGRRHSDQGCASSCGARLAAGIGRAGSVEADPELAGERFGLAHEAALLVVAAGEQRRFRARQALPLGEIDEALQINLGDIDVVRKPHEIVQLRDASP